MTSLGFIDIYASIYANENIPRIFVYNYVLTNLYLYLFFTRIYDICNNLNYLFVCLDSD